MRRLDKNIRIKLFLFLGIISLIVNLVSFSILSNYNKDKYMELAMIHVDQQYQNGRQRLAVLGQQIRLLGENQQLTAGVVSQDWGIVEDKITGFLQSIREVISLKIYRYDQFHNLSLVRDGSAIYTVDFTAENVEEFWDQTKDLEEPIHWFLREKYTDKYEYLSFLMPIYSEERHVGFMLADINIVEFVDALLNVEDFSYWEESIAVVSSDKKMYVDGSVLIDQHDLADNMEEKVQINDNMIFSVKKIPQFQDYIIQVISINTEKMLTMPAILMSTVFFVSLAIIYFGVHYITKSIMVPLESLQQKMVDSKFV